jgi:hypothetical protein
MGALQLYYPVAFALWTREAARVDNCESTSFVQYWLHLLDALLHVRAALLRRPKKQVKQAIPLCDGRARISIARPKAKIKANRLLTSSVFLC